MKSPKILITVLLLVNFQLLISQQVADPWEKWKYLTGEWVGQGNGQPGQGEGKFSFGTELDGRILVRKNHTVFPATADSPEKVHDDLLIIYQGNGDEAAEAIYFDNEGHTIKYKVSYKEKSIILTSEIIPNNPRFRFSYTPIDDKTVNLSFEIAAPQAPEEFKMYISGKADKVK
jgi:hypothetical protein